MNNKTIIVDIGNSFISVGIFTDMQLTHRLDINSSITDVAHVEKTLQQFFDKNKFATRDMMGGLICSVVPMYSRSLQKAIRNVFGIEVPIMDSSYNSQIKMLVDDPNEVGGDIVADVKAANILYGGSCIVIDLGTITKNIVLDKEGVFIGTSFFPGVQVCMDVMREKTALLPGFEIDKKPKKLLGNNTIEAMQSGVYYGTIDAIISLCRHIEKEIGYPLKKILTGGNSKIFKELEGEFIIDQDLVLKGIYYLYRDR